MRAQILLGLLMLFSSSTHKVSGSPNLDTFVDDQDFGGSGDYSDHRAIDHRGGDHLLPHYTPTSPGVPDHYAPSSSDTHSHDTSRGEGGGGGGLLDANAATYDDEDYADYGSGDYDEAYDGEAYDDDYDVHAEEEHTTTTTPAPTTTTTTTTQAPVVVEVTTTSTTTTTTTTPPRRIIPIITTPSTTTTTTPPPRIITTPSTTTTTTMSPTTSPPSSIMEENGIYSTDDERERNKKKKKDKDYGYEDGEEYDDEYYDGENYDNYDDEDYGGEGSGAGVVGTHEDVGGHHDEVQPHHEDTHHEDHATITGEDHFTFDKAPVEEAAEEDHVIPHHHTPEHEEPAPPRTTDEIWLSPVHPDPHVPVEPKEEEEEDDLYDDSDPYGRHRPVDKADDDLSLGAGDDHYGRSGSTNNMDGSVQIVTHKEDERTVSIFAQPGILAAFIGGAVVGLLCAILLVMFVVYRMRKKDEGSYPLDEPKRLPLTSSYATTDKEIYA